MSGASIAPVRSTSALSTNRGSPVRDPSAALGSMALARAFMAAGDVSGQTPVRTRSSKASTTAAYLAVEKLQ